jgi:hypothetical protein
MSNASQLTSNFKGDHISVLMFGATGQGAVDDSGAIQAAINWTFENGGGWVFFPQGTYLCQGLTLLPTVWLYGAGHDATFLTLPNGANKDMFTSAGFSVLFPTIAAATDPNPSTNTSPYAVVNVSGTAVTWVSGQQFQTEQSGFPVMINGEVYTFTYISATSGTISSSAGTLSNAPFVDLTLGIWSCGLRNMTLDGNKANNTSGNGIQVYGFNMVFEHLRVHDFAQTGITTGWAATGNCTMWTDFMESRFYDIKSHDNGVDGWDFYGPHDSVMDAVETYQNAATGFYEGRNGAGTFKNLHSYGPIQLVAARFDAGQCVFSCCVFETAQQVNLQLNCGVDGDCTIFGAPSISSIANAVGLAIGQVISGTPVVPNGIHLRAFIFECGAGLLDTTYASGGGGNSLTLTGFFGTTTTPCVFKNATTDSAYQSALLNILGYDLSVNIGPPVPSFPFSALNIVNRALGAIQTVQPFDGTGTILNAPVMDNGFNTGIGFNVRWDPAIGKYRITHSGSAAINGGVIQRTTVGTPEWNLSVIPPVNTGADQELTDAQVQDFLAVTVGDPSTTMFILRNTVALLGIDATPTDPTYGQPADGTTVSLGWESKSGPSSTFPWFYLARESDNTTYKLSQQTGVSTFVDLFRFDTSSPGGPYFFLIGTQIPTSPAAGRFMVGDGSGNYVLMSAPSGSGPNGSGPFLGYDGSQPALMSWQFPVINLSSQVGSSVLPVANGGTSQNGFGTAGFVITPGGSGGFGSLAYGVNTLLVSADAISSTAITYVTSVSFGGGGSYTTDTTTVVTNITTSTHSVAEGLVTS